MQRPIRYAACEPCRLTKQACGHEKPVCERCRGRGRHADCIYRERPFKKRRLSGGGDGALSDLPDVGVKDGHQPESSAAPADFERYPRAGYLGLSSHAAIFDKLLAEEGNATPLDDLHRDDSHILSVSGPQLDKSIHAGAEVLKAIVRTMDISKLAGLIEFWLAKQTKLALGGMFLPHCIDGPIHLLLKVHKGHDSALLCSRRLTANSRQALSVETGTTFLKFCIRHCVMEIRWDTIILFLVAVGRASADTPFYPALYTQTKERRLFQKAASALADRCLEIALCLDRLNDLLLIAQYESWILFTTVGGDHSFDAWCRCGDVISSLLFLGYHDDVKADPTVPAFLIQLRRAIFAQIYADDKNVAVFLGRPPRLSRRFCCFQLPDVLPDQLERVCVPVSGAADLEKELFNSETPVDATAALRWTAACALLKEEALDTLQKRGSLRRDCFDIAAVHERAKKIWSMLPAQFRLENSMNEHRHRTPFEQDLLLNVRLTYLQVLFLLHGGEFTHCPLDHQHDRPDILNVSIEMLALVAEAMVRKNQLVNSGTSLVWKVVHYGLPAAGLISLSIMNPHPEHPAHFPSAKTLQDLSVFVAEIQGEGLVGADEPNFALLYRAASGIHGLLQRVFSNAVRQDQRDGIPGGGEAGDSTGDEFAQLAAWLQSDSWGYDEDFWSMLEQHAQPAGSTDPGFAASGAVPGLKDQ